MERVNVAHFDNANSVELKALDFYKQEIDTLKERLTEIAGKNTNQDVMKQVEHYENQFKVQANGIGSLIHDIHNNDRGIHDQLLKSKEGYVAKELLKVHVQLTERFNVEEKIFKDLREDFMQFAATWL